MSYEYIIYERRGHIAQITLNRPEVLNSRNEKMRLELIQAYNEVKSDREVTVLIVTGAGEKSFCTGRDLKEIKKEGSVFESRRAALGSRDTEVLANLDKPVIAAINGYALGGGLELALGCDFRIAVDTAKMGLTEVKRGMIPGSGGTQRLPRLIGKVKALEMLYTGKMVTAQEALSLGMINEVVSKEELMPRAYQMAEEIAANAPIALMFIKEAVNKGMDMPLSQALTMEINLFSILETTEDLLEGAKAFVEKRPPIWKGR